MLMGNTLPSPQTSPTKKNRHPTRVLEGQKAQFLPSREPFLYLGVQLTMDLNWRHQIRRMTYNLREKLENLNFSLTSPRRAKDMIHVAIVFSLAYAFCSYSMPPSRPLNLGQND
eukprot:1148732-Pelagomonas_calceolata.AAC.3